MEKQKRSAEPGSVVPTAAPRAAAGGDSLRSLVLGLSCQNVAAIIVVGNGGWNLAEHKW